MSGRVLTSETALPDLRWRLEHAGFRFDQPSLAVFWPVWRQWAALPVQGLDPEDEDDALLFECSLDLVEPRQANSPGPHFRVAFTRQFTHRDADGEYLGMEQLGAEFIYPPDEDFRAITTMESFSPDRFGTADLIWGEPGARADEWAMEVETSSSYRTAVEHPVRQFSLDQAAV